DDIMKETSLLPLFSHREDGIMRKLQGRDSNLSGKRLWITWGLRVGQRRSDRNRSIKECAVCRQFTEGGKKGKIICG
ncbi:MAG: hypothetical protein QM228_03295, partial [Atribacterota bacterium]|nr:hypothetical protein [Atribacterota bacterium]